MAALPAFDCIRERNYQQSDQISRSARRGIPCDPEYTQTGTVQAIQSSEASFMITKKIRSRSTEGRIIKRKSIIGDHPSSEICRF